MTLRRKIITVLTVVLSAGVLAAVAWAANTHTVGDWYHGMGDGANDNYFVHPFAESSSSAFKDAYVELNNSGTVWQSKTCPADDFQHCHFDRDTSPVRECTFHVHIRGGSNLALHRHDHHNFCG
jgi:hypothetical protein